MATSINSEAEIKYLTGELTFCMLACSTLSKLCSVPLPSDLACERKTPEEIEVPDDKLELMSNAAIAEVP